MSPAADPRPLVAHVMHRLDVGGLENGVVNLVNAMPAYRHAIIALTEVTEFRRRILRDDVTLIALEKKPGHGYPLYPRVNQLFRKLRPAIAHTRNLAALEMTVPAWAAGVHIRIHGEHGRDVGDLDGSSRRSIWTRQLYRPFVSHYVAVSEELADNLRKNVGIRATRITRICNGVDMQRFGPAPVRQPITGCPFVDPALWLVGTVGRMAEIKDPLTLANAFVRMRRADSTLSHVRLAMVGSGPLLSSVRETLRTAKLLDDAWLPGERGDVAAVLRGLDCFVLPSLGEGISNTILEAMAAGLPVLATDVGGNAELVEDGRTGTLVPPADPDGLAGVLRSMAHDPAAARVAGAAGRARAERLFSLQSMIAKYQALYDRLLHGTTPQSFSVQELQ